MNQLMNIWDTTVGKKVVMALTGIVLIAFITGHMVGNLLLFSGPDSLNAYAELLHAEPVLLWMVRLVMLVSFPLHILAAVQLTQRAAQARPVAYKQLQSKSSTVASKMMRMGGVTIMIFVIFHLAHYTLNVVDPSFAGLHDDEGRHDVFRMVVTGFSEAWALGFYLVAVSLLGMHLRHGVWSAMQTLGANHPAYNELRKQVATAFAIIISLGFAAGPIAVFAGLVK